MHTIKTQVEIGASTLLIYSIRFAKGSVHDFSLFKESPSDYNEDSTLFIDKGYMGIAKIHHNSIIPIKASKKHKLTDVEKWYNNEISKIRISIEHVNAFIKKFKIISTRFRNRRKNFKLYMSLICGIYNFETANLQFTDRPNKQGDTISIFLEKLQNLPKLSKEELEDISENIKKLINNKK